MRVEEIDDFEAFLDLASEWETLADETGAPSFFLSHAWFRCCWLGSGEDVRPVVVTVRDGSRLVGVAPFFGRAIRWRLLPVRALALMQNQDTPFADVLLGGERPSEVLRAILAHLEHHSTAHLLSFTKVRRSSPTHALLSHAGAAQPVIRSPGGHAPLLKIQGDWAGFWAAQSQRFKKTVRNVVNRVERLGRVAVEEISSSAPPERCMQIFAEVSALSWKARLPTSLGRNPDIRRFFEALTGVLHSQARLLLWVLSIDGVAVATEYHVRDGHTVSALRSDFDERCREASPGAYLNDRIVREYFERGVRTYDMGPGDNPYKQRWASGVREFGDFSFFRRRPYPMALYALEQQAVPRLRQARDWWRGEVAARSEDGEVSPS